LVAKEKVMEMEVVAMDYETVVFIGVVIWSWLTLFFIDLASNKTKEEGDTNDNTGNS
jgi:hypothetical protein